MENIYTTEAHELNFSDMSYVRIKEFVDNLKSDYNSDYSKQQILAEAAVVLSLDKRKNIRDLSVRLLNFINASNKELERVKGMYDFDRQYSKTAFIAGVDEVGRGPLAGPIVGAAVVLNLNISNERDLLLGIKDSKKLSGKLREELSEIIKSKALAFSIASIDNNLIDTRGIAWCNNEIFRMSVQKLKRQPGLVLSDGYPIKNFSIPNNYIIKGDSKSANIACASIIAKVYRDNLMKEYAKLYSGYGFEENAGYGTNEHIQAIKKQGPCKIHRMTFLTNIL
jgi:ribonuclease HII